MVPVQATIEDQPSATLWQRLTRGVRCLRQRHDWETFAGTDWAERIMAAAVTDRFHAKQGRSTGRWVLEAEGRSLSVYLKRHYRLPWWRGLLATVFPERGWSPALSEWQHLEWARAQGVPVPRAVAAGEYIGPWGRLQSFLAVEELVDMLPLHEALPAAAARLEPRFFQHWKRGLIREMARLIRDLHERRCFHKDLYLCHFYISRTFLEGDSLIPRTTRELSGNVGQAFQPDVSVRPVRLESPTYDTVPNVGQAFQPDVSVRSVRLESPTYDTVPNVGQAFQPDGSVRPVRLESPTYDTVPLERTVAAHTWQGHVFLIDLHRLGHHPFTAWLWQVKDLAQLLYSSEVAGVQARDRLRFWKYYLGKPRRTPWQRCLRRLVLLKWRLYRRHHARRKITG